MRWNYFADISLYSTILTSRVTQHYFFFVTNLMIIFFLGVNVDYVASSVNVHKIPWIYLKYLI